MGMAPGEWLQGAACAGAEPDTLFVRGAAQRRARQLCFDCPVRVQCLAEALRSRAEFGVWGGLTERERRALLKAFPSTTDWTAYLQTDDELATELRERRPARVIALTRSRRAG